jgi:predicted transcriptional regulator
MIMNASDIKIDIFRKLDSLKGNKLKEAYGMLLNFINGKKDFDDWENFTEEQKEALKLGIKQLDEGEGRSHNDLMEDIRNQYVKKK